VNRRRAHARACFVAGELTLALTSARARFLGPNPTSTFDLGLDSFLASALQYASGLAHDLVDLRGSFSAHHLDRTLHAAFDYACRDARFERLATELGEMFGPAQELNELLAPAEAKKLKRRARRVVVVSHAAQRVTAFTTRLLPAACRSIKSEEFAAELYDIAATGGSRRRQLAYALRLLATIVPLRRALAADGARRAVER